MYIYINKKIVYELKIIVKINYNSSGNEFVFLALMEIKSCAVFKKI